MLTVMGAWKHFEESCPKGAKVLLVISYLNDLDQRSSKDDIISIIKDNAIDDTICFLIKNGIISTSLKDKCVQYVVNRSFEVLPFVLSPFEKAEILGALKDIFPGRDKFNAEIGNLELLVRRHKLYDATKILLVLRGLHGTKLGSLRDVSKKDVEIILAPPADPEQEPSEAPTPTEKRLARMMYGKMTDKRLKDKLLRVGVQTKYIDEILQETGDKYRLEQVIIELKSMPVKFKFLE